MSKSRAVVPYGNDLVLYIEMKRWDEQQKSYIDFDMTNVTDLVVFLTCSKHATDIQLEYTVDEDHNNILVCPVDYRLLHTNASYGCYVEGYDENEKHFRFEMLPSELMLIISNTSGMQPNPNIGVIDIQGRVGWGIGEGGGDLSNYYNKQETDALLDEKQDELVSGTNIKTINNQSILGSGNITIGGGGTFVQEQADWNQNDNTQVDYIKNKPDLSQYATESDLDNYYTKGETDGLLNNKVDTSTLTSDYYNANTVDNLLEAKADTSDLNDKQDTLVSGTNIKTINNQSILGSGNITIEGGGGTQVQADWTETDTSDPSYIQHKPDLSIYAESANLATVATTGSYNDLSNKPDLSIYAQSANLATVATSGDYDDLTNKPTLFSGDYDDLTNKPDLSIYAESSDLATVATTGSYNDLSNKPDLSNYATQSDLASKQDTLVSGTNIKTINNESILGSGNITIDNDEANEATANALFELNQKTNYNEQAIEALDASVKSQINQVVKDVNDIINNDVNAQLDEIDDELKAAALEINQLNTDKQDTLVSGTNIKTINNQSILGEGNITIEGGGGGTQVQADWTETDTSDPSYIQHKPDLSVYATQSDLASKQDTLVSGTNIKTINNESILGSGNITVDNDEANEATANALFELNQKTNYNEQAIESLDTSVKTQINQVVKDVNDIINNDVNAQLDEIDNEFKSAALEISQLRDDFSFVKLTQNNKTGLVNSLTKYYHPTYAIGECAVIEGDSEALSGGGYRAIRAVGDYSHAEGLATSANGLASHAEGYLTTANGNYAHASGCGTITRCQSEAAFGQYNYSPRNDNAANAFDNTSSTDKLFTIGNGTSLNNPHNAFEIRRNGDIYLNDGSKLQDVMVTSSTNSLKIEVVSALPASPDSNTIYIIQ